MDKKFCRDCKHFIYDRYCDLYTTQDPVTGRDVYSDAWVERRSLGLMYCGPNAQHFEPAPPPVPATPILVQIVDGLGGPRMAAVLAAALVISIAFFA